MLETNVWPQSKLLQTHGINFLYYETIWIPRCLLQKHSQREWERQRIRIGIKGRQPWDKRTDNNSLTCDPFVYPLVHTFQRTCTSRRTNRVTRTLHNDIFDVTDFALLRVAFNLSRRFKLTRRVTTATGPRDTRFIFHRKISPKRRDVPSLQKRPLVAWNESRLSPLSENVDLATCLAKFSCSSLASKHRSFRKIISPASFLVDGNYLMSSMKILSYHGYCFIFFRLLALFLFSSIFVNDIYII